MYGNYAPAGISHEAIDTALAKVMGSVAASAKQAEGVHAPLRRADLPRPPNAKEFECAVCAKCSAVNRLGVNLLAHPWSPSCYKKT